MRESWQLVNPATEKAFCTVQSTSEPELESTLRRMRAAQQEWRNVPVSQRIDVCRRFVERARRYAQELATDADLRLCAPKRLAGTPPAVLVAGGSRQRDPRVPPPGTKLIKRYKDETVTVTVLEDGYQYGERVYRSLSAIARQVTGTQWNGYLFFGLRLGQEQGRAE